MAPEVKRIHQIPKKIVTEGPHWDPDTQSLYFVNCDKCTIGKFTPSTGQYDEIRADNSEGYTVNFVIPVKDEEDTFICGIQRDVRLIKWNTEMKKLVRNETLASLPESDPPEAKINDGKCDSSGRLWFGTMCADEKRLLDKIGSTYSFSIKEGLRKHLSDVSLSNGVAFSKDSKKMFYVRSGTYQVDKYDLDIENGRLSKPGVAFDLKKMDNVSLPDGITIDQNDNLWVACFGGAQVINVDPRTNTLLGAVKIPTSLQITSACFGGENLDELYVTSANVLIDCLVKNTPQATEAGCTFRVTNMGVKGQPAVKFDMKR